MNDVASADPRKYAPFGMRATTCVSSSTCSRLCTSPRPRSARARAVTDRRACVSSHSGFGRERVVALATELVRSTFAPMKKLDAHLHVWPKPSDYAYAPGKEPPSGLAELATAESLLERFDETGVHGALIVQPINLRFDHDYVTRTIARHPGRFVGCCLADPTGGTSAGVAALSNLLTPNGVYRAVRFNPGLWPDGQRMTNDVGKEMFRLAGERDCYVGFMCFHGLHLHVEEIKDLMEEFPKTKVMMDHFGFTKGIHDPNWRALLSLAEYPQVVVKASAQFRVVPGIGEAADEGNALWPYPSTGNQLRGLVDAFGVHRVVWGSDFPYVEEQCGYEKATAIIANCGAELTERQVEAILGGNLERMFPGGWT